MPVQVEVTDRRTVRCPVPAGKLDTIDFAKSITKAATDGYVLGSAEEITGGSQRDPYVIGVLLTFERP